MKCVVAPRYIPLFYAQTFARISDMLLTASYLLRHSWKSQLNAKGDAGNNSWRVHNTQPLKVIPSLVRILEDHIVKDYYLVE